MQALQGQIEDFKLSGPHQSTKGFADYFKHYYTINGKVFNKLNKHAEALAPIGATVLVLFETKRTEKGEFNNIDKLTIMAGDIPAVTIKTIELNSTTQQPHKEEQKFNPPLSTNKVGGGSYSNVNSTNSFTSVPINYPSVTSRGSLTAKDLSIARQNAVTSAIRILSLQNINVGQPALETVISLANNIVEYTTEPLTNARVVERANGSDRTI